jgi:type II secretory pathway component PulF
MELPLGLVASVLDAYRRLGPSVALNIQNGMSLTMALAETGEFPKELLDAISVGEQGGSLAETMERQSKEYQRSAATAVSVIARIVGGIVWVTIAVIIIFLIVRVVTGYADAINSLSQPGGAI